MSFQVSFGSSTPTSPPINGFDSVQATAAQPRDAASTLNSADPSNQDASAPGWCEWITNHLRALWDALCSCFASREPEAVPLIPPSEEEIRAAALLEERIEAGGELIDRIFSCHRRDNLNRPVVVFNMTYNGQSIACFRKFQCAGEESIEMFVKKHLKILLAQAGQAGNCWLFINSFFLNSATDSKVNYTIVDSKLNMYALGAANKAPDTSSDIIALHRVPLLLEADVPRQKDSDSIMALIQKKY